MFAYNLSEGCSVAETPNKIHSCVQNQVINHTHVHMTCMYKYQKGHFIIFRQSLHVCY